MKINFNENQKQVSSIRSQIKDASDLKKFDDFLAEHDSFDFNDANDVAAAKGCCGGDKCCTITIGFESPIKMG
ncbi:MAG: hypothetical protein CMC76_01085 [Flavobacteriaceae bacterium]|uniref:hypothetical protein n=1 Tax=Winogradskyella sp. SYSU M77433 TaxID=3042722 RepID=UPI000C3D6201|nr:hypothetical protein [Winogradskyella sp. SYSU M77433]MAX69688.1 hypothetical protein [Flavobacteriaceae bacterium]MDH7913617.1 hypothetical protein [Winogradskyella sp. SYSU M77433]|tara:strand:+ start:5210 stop:5428 length:219 start_codon:yes stop_codon:yes gene_type:complete